jgi:hypothetical protein
MNIFCYQQYPLPLISLITYGAYVSSPCLLSFFQAALLSTRRTIHHRVVLAAAWCGEPLCALPHHMLVAQCCRTTPWSYSTTHSCRQLSSAGRTGGLRTYTSTCLAPKLTKKVISNTVEELRLTGLTILRCTLSSVPV